VPTCFSVSAVQHVGTEVWSRVATGGTMRLTLDNITNIAVVTTCAALVGMALTRTPAVPIGSTAANTPPYKVGDHMEPISGVSFADVDKTLLLFVSSTCTYCTQSMPFYKTLALQRRESKRPFSFIAVGQESEGIIRAYLTDYKIEIDHVKTLPKGTKFRGTPTLALVDRAGTVQGFWKGLLSESEQERVLRAVDRNASGSSN
jgi:hypothetical protein